MSTNAKLLLRAETLGGLRPSPECHHQEETVIARVKQDLQNARRTCIGSLPVLGLQYRPVCWSNANSL